MEVKVRASVNVFFRERGFALLGRLFSNRRYTPWNVMF